jgi:hypothetical protein
MNSNSKSDSPSGSDESSKAGVPQKQESPIIPEFAELAKLHPRLSGVLKATFKPFYRGIPRFAQGPTPEADEARFERVFRPWPKWVFRLAAEKWHVDNPTISKEIFFETFRVLHVMLFRCPTNPTAESFPISRRNIFDRTNFDVLPIVLASFFGHAFEHLAAFRRKLDAKRAEGLISAEEYEEAMKASSPESLEDAFRQTFAQWTQDKNVQPTELFRAVEIARRKTFDRHGHTKETPRTATYRVMLSNWIIIEKMTGAKDLTHFLSLHLKDYENYGLKEQASVATMCSRLRIIFRGKIK